MKNFQHPSSLPSANFVEQLRTFGLLASSAETPLLDDETRFVQFWRAPKIAAHIESLVATASPAPASSSVPPAVPPAKAKGLLLHLGGTIVGVENQAELWERCQTCFALGHGNDEDALWTKDRQDAKEKRVLWPSRIFTDAAFRILPPQFGEVVVGAPSTSAPRRSRLLWITAPDISGTKTAASNLDGSVPSGFVAQLRDLVQSGQFEVGLRPHPMIDGDGTKSAALLRQEWDLMEMEEEEMVAPSTPPAVPAAPSTVPSSSSELLPSNEAAEQTVLASGAAAEQTDADFLKEKNILLFPAAQFPFFVPVIDWADVLVGPPAGVLGAAAGFFSDKTVVATPRASGAGALCDQEGLVMPTTIIRGLETQSVSLLSLGNKQSLLGAAGRAETKAGKKTENPPSLARVIESADQAQHPPNGILPKIVRETVHNLVAQQEQKAGGGDAPVGPSNVAVEQPSSCSRPADNDHWRKAWFDTYFSCVDGFENYRTLLLIGKTIVKRRVSPAGGTFSTDDKVAHLANLYKKLPVRRSPTNNGQACDPELLIVSPVGVGAQLGGEDTGILRGWEIRNFRQKDMISFGEVDHSYVVCSMWPEQSLIQLRIIQSGSGVSTVVWFVKPFLYVSMCCDRKFRLADRPGRKGRARPR